MLPRPLLSCLIATCMLTACERNATDTATISGAPASHATAATATVNSTPAPATVHSAAAPAAASSAAIPASAQTAQSAGDGDSEGPSASLAGVAHDADPDPASLKDPYLLPGSITADTEPDGLRRIYGAANVKEGEVPGAEGESAQGVILFPDDPKRRAYVYFQNEKTLTGISMVRVTDEDSQWHGAHGIRIGMPVADLVKVNGRPFKFSGFDWDYGGQVVDWLGGKLAPAKGGATLHVILTHGDQPKGVPTAKLPIGDGSFRSDHPQLAKMKATVVEISLDFPGHDDR